MLNWRQLKAFLNQVIIRDDDECWQWQGSTNRGGYGVMSLKGIASLAHRVAWMIYKGELVQEGKYVCHHCDNPSCVNPRHLYLGDHEQNMKDAAVRGRLPNKAGEANGNSRLTGDQVLDIRRMRAAGVKRRIVAEKFGVSTVTVDRIALGEGWTHIRSEPDNDEEPTVSKKRAPAKKPPARGKRK